MTITTTLIQFIDMHLNIVELKDTYLTYEKYCSRKGSSVYPPVQQAFNKPEMGELDAEFHTTTFDTYSSYAT